MAPNRTTAVPRSCASLQPLVPGLYSAWQPAPPRDTPWPHPRSMEWSVCGTIEDAKKYAQQLMPGVLLDYIPKRERDERNWVDDEEYLDPRRGLLRWCGNAPPKTKGAIARTKMYVIGNTVGPTVDAVVRSVHKQGAIQRRSRPKVEIGWTEKEEVRHRVWGELEHLRGVPPSHYWGRLDTLDADEMYNLISNKGATKLDFLTWIDLAPGRRGTDRLSDSMESLKLDVSKTRSYEAGDELSNEWDEWEETLRTDLAEAINSSGVPGLVEEPPTIPPEELLHLEID